MSVAVAGITYPRTLVTLVLSSLRAMVVAATTIAAPIKSADVLCPDPEIGSISEEP